MNKYIDETIKDYENIDDKPESYHICKYVEQFRILNEENLINNKIFEEEVKNIDDIILEYEQPLLQYEEGGITSDTHNFNLEEIKSNYINLLPHVHYRYCNNSKYNFINKIFNKLISSDNIDLETVNYICSKLKSNDSIYSILNCLSLDQLEYFGI